MSFIGQCFGSISNCFYGTQGGGHWDAQKAAQAAQVAPATPDVFLDSTVMGTREREKREGVMPLTGKPKTKVDKLATSGNIFYEDFGTYISLL